MCNIISGSIIFANRSIMMSSLVFISELLRDKIYPQNFGFPKILRYVINYTWTQNFIFQISQFVILE